MREKSTHFNRELLFQIKGTICCNCNKNVKEQIIYHHVIPISLGGNDVINNIVPLCNDCHNIIHHHKKADTTFSHSELIKAGLRKAQEEGVNLGRPKMTTNDLQWFLPYYKQWKDKKINKKDLALSLKISRPTLDKYITIIETK